MLEKHRLTYLDALGLENYMPRYQLSGALPSQLLSDDALREPTAFSTADSQTVALVSGADLADSDVLDSLEKNTASTLPPAATDVMSALGITSNVDHKNTLSTPESTPIPDNVVNKDSHPSPEQVIEETDKNDTEGAVSIALLNSVNRSDEQAPIRFSLNIWRIQNELLVIDSREPAAALPTEKLLQNILRSIGYPLAQLPSSDLVRWPLFSNKKLASAAVNQSSDEEEARAMVQAYLSAQCNRAPIKTLLLLGENAAGFALTPNEGINAFYQQHKGTAVDTPLWGSTVLVAPSLVEMLHDPMQKRITWQALQALFTESD